MSDKSYSRKVLLPGKYLVKPGYGHILVVGELRTVLYKSAGLLDHGCFHSC